MSVNNNSEYIINEKATRLLEEVVESLRGNIIRQVPEDCALIAQAYGGVCGQMLSEKYKQLIEDVDKLSDDIVYQIEKLDTESKHNLMS